MILSAWLDARQPVPPAALRARIDAALGTGGRAERGAVVEVGAPVPLAVPAVQLEVARERGALLIAARGEQRIAAPARKLAELGEHRAEEESEPHALAAAPDAHQVHAVVPVARPHERQAVRADAQAVLDRPHAVLVCRGGVRRAPRQVVIGVVALVHRAALEERDRLVEHARIAGRVHVARHRERQPQVVVGATRAHAAARRRVPPVLHVALDELAAGAAQQVLAQELGLGVHQRHPVLQLVAEAECAAGLVVAAAGPHAAGDGLVHQPAVGQQVQRNVRCGDLHGAQRMAPVRMDLRERRPRGGAAAIALHQLAGLVGAAAHAEAKDDLARRPRRQLDRHLDRAAGIEPGTGATGQTGPAHRRRPA